MSLLSDRLTSDATRNLAEARRLARARGHELMEAGHVFQADVQTAQLLVAAARRLGTSLGRFRATLAEHLRDKPVSPLGDRVQPRYAPDLRACLDDLVAGDAPDGTVGWPAVLAAVLRTDWGSLTELLREAGFDPSAAAEVVEGEFALAPATPAPAGPAPSPPPDSDALALYCVDLTRQAREGKLVPALERETEVAALMTVLAQKVTNNPLLVGEPGVGKTALVEELALRIADGRALLLGGKRVLALDLGALLAGASYRGEFEERLKRVIEAVRVDRGQTLLFVDEVHTLLGAGRAGGGPDAANLLKPALARGELWMIGATTYAEYRQHLEKDKAFERRFQRVDVQPPSAAVTRKILDGVRERFEAHHRVSYPPATLDAVVELAERHLGWLQFPDKAIKVLDRCGARAAVAAAAEQARGARRAPQTQAINPADVRAVVADMAAIPVDRLEAADARTARRTGDRLRERLVGQDEAVDHIEKRLELALTALRRPDRPRAVLLFAGPAGVGKSSAAAAVAAEFGSTPQHQLVLDMAGFTERESVQRLTGAPPGYVGYEEGGQLTDALWRRPASVVIVENLDLAHREVRNLLQMVIEAGQAADARGRVSSAIEAVFVLTTRCAPERLPPGLAGSADEVVAFAPLESRHAVPIAEHYLAEVGARAAVAARGKALAFELSDAARQAVGENFDPELGARSVRAYVDRAILAPFVRAHPDLANLKVKKVIADVGPSGYTFIYSSSSKTLPHRGS
jgi:ATP-dependent Clp protease ATP-binding subunit ClpA